MSEQALRKSYISDTATHCLYLSSPGSQIITIFAMMPNSTEKVDLSQRFYYYNSQPMTITATHFVSVFAKLFKNIILGVRDTSKLLSGHAYCGHHIFCADTFHEYYATKNKLEGHYEKLK